MAQRGRVQVNDLSEPERLSAVPVQRDTFVQPAQAPINNDLERLASALGHFNSNLQAYGARQEANAEKQRREWEKAHKEQVESDLARHSMTRTSGELVQEFYGGGTPHFDDPYLKSAQAKLWAQSLGDVIGQQIDADIEAGKLPLDQEDFNPQRYVLELAKPHLERLRDRPELMAPFAHEIEAAQKSVAARYKATLGKARTMRLEQAAALQIEDAFDDGVEDGLEGEDLMAYIRSKYVGLGPRISGGALDIGYDRLDDLALDVMKRKAKDPAVAEKVLGALDANRKALDGSNQDIGPVSAVNKHSPTVESIRGTAFSTLADQFDADAQREQLAKNTALFNAEDGSFSGIGAHEIKNPWNQKTTELGADKQKEAAAINWLRQYRESPDYNPQHEVVVFMHNGVKHPEFFNKLEATFQGIGNTNLRDAQSIAPDQAAQIIEAGKLYETMANANYAYVEKNLSDKAKDFFETYRYLLRYNLSPGAPAESVALQAVRAFSSDESMRNPEIERDTNQRIASAVNDIGRGWFQSNPENHQELFVKARKLTTIFVRANGGDIQKAADAAVARINESAVRINGRTLTGLPGIMPGDVKNVERILDAQFTKHSKTLKAMGVEDAGDLTVFPARDGAIQIGTKDGLVVVDENRKPLIFTAADVAKVRRADDTLARAKALQHSRERRAGNPWINPSISASEAKAAQKRTHNPRGAPNAQPNGSLNLSIPSLDPSKIKGGHKPRGNPNAQPSGKTAADNVGDVLRKTQF